MFEKLKTFLRDKTPAASPLADGAGDGISVSLPELLAQKRYVPLLSFDAVGTSKAEGMGVYAVSRTRHGI